MKNRETIHAKSDFIELLTHDSYVIQAGRIKDTSYTSDLDKLLSIFEQAYFIRADSELIKEYHHQPDNDNIELITSILCEMVSDPVERKQLEDEVEAMRILDAVYFSKIKERDIIIEEQTKSLEEHAKILEEKDKSLKEQSQSLKEKNKALEEKDRSLEEQSKSLKEKDKSLEEQAKFLNEKNKQIAELQRLLQIKQVK
jgi:DNA repair exonuclease SbcCD ATPase subunit